jgi:tetratricopeptide (TPR) repeat protein
MSATTVQVGTPCPDLQTLRKLLCDDLPPGEGGRVEEHVGACPGCQRALRGLLDSLPDTVAGALTAAPAPGDDDAPPQLPGYEPLGRIDAGGMGVVWRARDLQFGRRLAVKVMKWWASASPAMVDRFTAEARVCGQLAHPYIVPIHTMGRLPDGRPYYAMKLVEGRTLAALLEGRPAPVERRMGLVQVFGQLCQAVAYAHSQRVIHRDLKPDNVMVGAHGEVQLMDWGLAKVLGDGRPPDGAGSTLSEPACGATTRTRAGSVLGTVGYMPPEQARGEIEGLDRRSDVFSLGAVLCEILTGEPPYADTDVQVARRRAAEADLAEGLARLRGSGADPELVRLAERCLAPDKANRPADGGEVAAAVAAYLSGAEERLQQERLRREREQVQAAEERRRRNLWMGLAGAVLVVLAVGIVGTTLGLVRAERARDAEETQRRIAQGKEQEAQDQKKQAIAFRDKALDALRATTGDDVQKLLGAKPELGADERAYLEAIAKRWQAFAAQEGDDEQSRTLRGEGHFQVALLWQRLGRMNEARSEYEQARDIRQGLAGGPGAPPPARLDLAFTRSSLGDVFYLLGKWDEALVEYKQARDIQQELAAQTPAPPRAPLDLALTRNGLGNVLYAVGTWDEARAEYEEALDIYQKAAAQAPLPPEAQMHRAGTHSNLGVLLQFALRKRDEARREYEMARDIKQELHAQFPGVSKYQFELVSTRVNLALLLAELGKRDEARVEYEQALGLQKEIADRFPAVLAYQELLAVTRINLGVLLNELGKRDEARREYEQARDIEQQLHARFPLVPAYQYELSAAHHNLGHVLDALGKYDAARRDYEQAQDLRQELAARHPTNHGYQVDLGRTRYNLADLIRDRQGQPADSLPWFDKAIETLAAAHAKEPRDVTANKHLRNSYWGRAQALDALHRPAEAMKGWQKAIELSSEPEVVIVRASRATSWVKAGRVAEGFAEIGRLTGAGEWNELQCYEVARFYAVTTGKAIDNKQKKGYGDRAMGLLRKAVQAGWKDGAHMAKDSDLDPLRDREDFRQLLKELDAKAPAPSAGRK